MQKPKRGRALFDLLSDEREEITDLLKRGTRWSHAKAREPDTPVKQVDPQAGAAGLRLAGSKAGIRFDKGWLVLEGRQLRLSLTPVSGAVVIFVVVLLLTAAFMIGSRSGWKGGLRAGYQEGLASYGSDQMSEVEIARNQPAASHLVRDLLESPPVATVEPIAAPGVQDRPGWTRDHTYIVAQEFSGSRGDDAEAARVFLSEHGIETVVVRFASGALQLITAQGYDHQNPAQKVRGEELLRQLHAVGAKYYRSGGGYKLEGYFRKLTSDRW